jgi:small-conductance mechanosensitive channel
VNWDAFHVWVTHPLVQTLLIAGSGYPVGWLLDTVGFRLLGRVASKTRTDYDDRIVSIVRKPVRTSALLASLWVAVAFNNPLPAVAFYVRGTIASWALFVWTRALFGVSNLMIEWLASIEGRFSAVTPRTTPAWIMTSHLLVVTVAAYFFFLCWDFDVTGWLASAGIVGVAVGFGAKDTMANLFAGVGILADNTYRLGDFLLLDTGERGRVTDIGLRSTRLLTQDEMEIIVPNSAMATAKIINESGGPREAERIRINVSVGYGSDVDEVRSLLLEVASRTEGVLQSDPNRKSSVLFTKMGDSGLDFQLLCFIGRPEEQPIVIDRLNTGAYKALTRANIDIPYPQRTVHMVQSTQDGQ